MLPAFNSTLIARFLLIVSLGGCAFAQAAPAPEKSAESLRAEAARLEQGSGTSRNTAQAVKLYCQAADQGDEKAQFRLGWIYANGVGLPRDDNMAAYFFAMAARQGHPQAERMLRLVGRHQGPTPECLFDTEGKDIVANTPASRQKVVALITRLAPEYGIYPRLALAIAGTESAFNPQAVSPKNAQGLMQLIPETAERFNVRKPLDPEQNVRGGLAYLRWLLAYFEGNVTLAAAAYNAGEGAVDRYTGIPPYPETRAYVGRILQVFKKEIHPFDASITAPSPRLGRIVLKQT